MGKRPEINHQIKLTSCNFQCFLCLSNKWCAKTFGGLCVLPFLPINGYYMDTTHHISTLSSLELVLKQSNSGNSVEDFDNIEKKHNNIL